MPRISLNNIHNEQKLKVRSLSLIVTRNCNLQCSYCYEKHNLRGQEFIPFPVGRDSILHYLNNDDEFNFLEIDFFGGEPLLAFPLIKKIVEWVTSQEWNKPYIFSIGTNGTVLDEEIKNWLTKYRDFVKVSFSIDGCKEAHDLARSNSYDRLSENIPFFKANWPTQTAKMTVSTDTIPYLAQSIIHLEELGLEFTANLGFEDMWGDREQEAQLLKAYEDQLDKLVDYYVKNDHLYPPPPILTALPTYLGLNDQGESQRSDCNRYCGAGHEMVVIDIDGQYYPCHRFIPWITGREAPIENGNLQSSWKPESCMNCKLVLSCPTCAGYNWEVNGDSAVRTTFHCESYKREVVASCKIEARRMLKSLDAIPTVSPEEKRQIRLRYNAINQVLYEGI